MANFFRYRNKNEKQPNVTLGCYSERGIMSYYFFNFLPNEGIEHFINLITTGNYENETPQEWKDINIQEADIEAIIYSELDLGKGGFGSPDGAVYFKIGEEAYFIFIEAKFNESYKQSCKKKNYNSTLKGQLELKNRFVEALYGEDEKVEVKNIIVKDFENTESNESKRTLELKEGVYKFCKIFEKVDKSNIYYLGITKESKKNKDKNPFKYDGRPSINSKKLLWLPADAIEDALEKFDAGKEEKNE